MLNIQTIRENKEQVIQRLAKKGFHNADLIEEVISLDERRRKLQHETDQMQGELKNISRQIGQLFASGKKEEAQKLTTQTAQLKEQIKIHQELQKEIADQLQQLLLQIPNLPHDSVPEGKGPGDNVIIRQHGDIPELAPDALPHWTLMTEYDIIDLELGAKITGAGFQVYKGKGAKLQRGLIQFFLDRALEAGYQEVIPPLLVNETTAFGTGQLPDKEGQMYHIELDDFYLIPTAEVPVTNIYRDEILDAGQLPVKMVAYTPCFRREAGSYGRDVRGLNRIHQFDKVEIVQIQHPDKSYETLEEMVNYVSTLLEALELPYRVVKLCGGDMSFTSALTYDMEVYSAAQQRWLEVSSISNFETFQSNRMKLRFRDENGKIQLAHTLNGSALALPRIVAALLENNQSPDGIRLPEALHPYLGFEKITRKP